MAKIALSASEIKVNRQKDPKLITLSNRENLANAIYILEPESVGYQPRGVVRFDRKDLELIPSGQQDFPSGIVSHLFLTFGTK